MDKETAAHRITSFFVKRFRKIKIGKQNVSIYFKEPNDQEKVKPIFNIFNYNPKQGKGLQREFFLQEFYQLMKSFGNNYDFNFRIYKDDDDEDEDSLDDELDEDYDGGGSDDGIEMKEIRPLERVSAKKEPEIKEPLERVYAKKEPEIKILFIDRFNVYREGVLTDEMLNNYFFPYILYLFANGKLNPRERFLYDISLQYNHPDAVSLTGIHEDNTTYTSLTYINSPVSTELAFDDKLISKLGLSKDISPLFRFDTSNSLCTLWFIDKYVKHTVPVYEVEGKKTEELNNFGNSGDFMTESVEGSNSFLVFENPEPFGTRKSYSKPLSRKKIPPPEKRKVIMFFVERAFFKPDSRLISKNPMGTFPLSVLEDYKLDYPDVNMELSKEVIDTILTQPTLGQTKFIGGKTRRKYKKGRKTYKKGKKTYKNKDNKKKKQTKTKK
jgi:hypothetical protein